METRRNPAQCRVQGRRSASRTARHRSAAVGGGSGRHCCWRWRPDANPVYLAKPLTFMNLSGGAARMSPGSTDRADRRPRRFVADVQPPGASSTARASGTEGGHNGLQSVADVFGTIEYPRLRIGVGRGDARRDLANHVRGSPRTRPPRSKARYRWRRCGQDRTWVSDGLPVMMNRFNRAADSRLDGSANGAPKETEDDDTA